MNDFGRNNSYLNNWQLPLLPDYIRKWAYLTPENEAIIDADTGEVINYQKFDEMSDYYALILKNLGFKKGDVLVVQFLAVPEFFFLVYGCLKAGIIISPIDIRLQAPEVARDINKVCAKGFICPGNSVVRCFADVVALVRKKCTTIEHIIQWTPEGLDENIAKDSISFSECFSKESIERVLEQKELKSELEKEYVSLSKRDPALIIFTTGSTGEPKPALICHENIIINNCVASRGTGLFGSFSRLLNVMPTSHVAGTAQGPMTSWFVGGSVATMSLFVPDKAMEFIEKYKITFIGGVPTHFRMLWNLPDYEEYDLSSIKFALYGGSSVDKSFLEKLAQMSPIFGTAYGMTECGGFFSCTPKGISVDEMAGQVGHFFPDLAKVSIRAAMKEDNSAGEELPDGETGEICVEGGIIFLGYYNDPEATSKAISKDGILYTGDMGSLRNMGAYKAIVFSGRRKFVIKPKGYLVFPDEVSDYLARHPKVSQAQVLGVDHKIDTDGIFAFVQPKEGAHLVKEELDDYCKGIASYKRPAHIELWPVGVQFPVNNVNKVDILQLERIAKEKVEELRRCGGWDE